MKLSHIFEARYSTAGQTFVEYFVIIDPTNQEDPFVYFRPNGQIQTYEFPKRSSRFKSKEAAQEKLQNIRRHNEKRIKQLQAQFDTQTYETGEPYDVDDQAYDEEELEDYIKSHEHLDKVVIASLTVRGT